MITNATIHTLNARNNIMLEVMRDYFKLSADSMFREIQELHRLTVEALAKKGISYDKLKSALVPNQHRRETALVFDTTAIKSSWYGFDVLKQIIPLFDRKGNHSVLVGDYLDRPGHEERQVEAFKTAIRFRRDVVFRHPTQFYIVYINNLSDAMVQRFDEGLRDYLAYVGIADMTYTSDFKIYLSTMLVNVFIKHGSIILQGHEPDRAPNEDVNMSGYPFEENGYACRSVHGDLMDVLLAYKIERPVFKGFEVDTEFGLNAISIVPMALDDFRIQVEEAKLGYLKSEKNGSVERAGLQAISSEELAGLIKAKISGSYIYNLCLDTMHNIMRFNIIVELPTSASRRETRLSAALEYQPDCRTLRLITLY